MLIRLGRIEDPSIVESSGLVKSRRWANLFWTHNDSGGAPRIFAIRGDGRSVKNRSPGFSGIEVTGAENVDWEDIALDDRGYLIIGDIGNNIAHRPKLALYRVKEPDPFKDRATGQAETISVHFPDSPSLAFNCEALFWAKGCIYLLTKIRGDTRTGLYRVKTTYPKEALPLIRIGSFDFGAPVTGADASPDGQLLAVLTYQAVWLFERAAGTGNYLRGKRSSFPLTIWQAEAVCFGGNRLIIGNETGDLFELEIAALLPLK